MDILDTIYHDTLKDMNPGLYDAVKQLVEAGQNPRIIAQRVEQQAGKDSVLSGLIEGTAKTIKKNLANA